MTIQTANAKRLNRTASAIALAVGLVATPALAQAVPDAEDQASVPEITVTAQRKS